MTAASATHRPKIIPGLDGLRALAVLLVVLFHQHLIEFGWIGVQFFFVLSGFLITRILHGGRDTTLGAYLRDFYGRRALRIFPLYFSVLALIGVGLAFGVRAPGAGEGLPYAATYTYNLYHASRGFVHSFLISHFWSLSVEEQFYLVWPFFIYFCPPRYLRRALGAIVLAGPLLRFLLGVLVRQPWMPVYHQPDLVVYVLTVSHLDAFAIGAFFSLFPLGGNRKALLVATLMALAAGSLAVAVSHDIAATWDSLGYPLGLTPGAGYIWGYTAINVVGALGIDCLAAGKLAPRFFNARVMRYLGKISYGLYILHYPMQSLVGKILPRAPVALQMALQIALTVGGAAVSFELMESRFLSLKDRWFPSRPRVARREPAPDVVVERA